RFKVLEGGVRRAWHGDFVGDRPPRETLEPIVVRVKAVAGCDRRVIEREPIEVLVDHRRKTAASPAAADTQRDGGRREGENRSCEAPGRGRILAALTRDADHRFTPGAVRDYRAARRRRDPSAVPLRGVRL